MGMYSAKSYRLTKDEYNYLLPVLRSKMLNSNDDYHFIGDTEDLEDMLNRLRGLYGHFEEHNPTITYNCGKNGNLEAFRNAMAH